MSKQSIYEANWINLVFEHKNKEYGAYQLRQDSGKTSLTALFIGVLLCATIVCIPKVVGLFQTSSTNTSSSPLDPIERIIEIANITPPVAEPIREMPAVKSIVEKIPEVTIKKQLVNPTIVKPELATPDIATNVEAVVIQPTTNNTTGVIGKNPTLPSKGNNVVFSTPTNYGDTLVTSAILDKLPEFPGGINKFYAFVANKFESPEIYNEKTIKIYVSFVVEKDGSMSNIQVKNNPGYGLDKEAIRVLKSMRTKWLPGMIDKQVVRTAYNLPIMVQVN